LGYLGPFKGLIGPHLGDLKTPKALFGLGGWTGVNKQGDYFLPRGPSFGICKIYGRFFLLIFWVKPFPISLGRLEGYFPKFYSFINPLLGGNFASTIRLHLEAFYFPKVG